MGLTCRAETLLFYRLVTLQSQEVCKSSCYLLELELATKQEHLNSCESRKTENYEGIHNILTQPFRFRTLHFLEVSKYLKTVGSTHTEGHMHTILAASWA